MEPGECVIVIRNYKPGDEEQCRRIVRDATMSTAGAAFRAALTREVTWQLMVGVTAVLFIFADQPPTVCLLSIPVTVVFTFVAVYCAHLAKAQTMADDMQSIPRTYMSSEYTGFWVAEAFTSSRTSSQVRIVREDDPLFEAPRGDFARSLVGTAAIVGSKTDSSAAWLRRMAVAPGFQRRGIANALIDQILYFCKTKGYKSIELVTTECHNAARDLYIKKGFQLRQLYHKQIVANIVQILMYEFTYSFQGDSGDQ